MNQFTQLSRSTFIARAKARLTACLPNTPLSWMGWTAVPLVLGASFMAFSQSTPPAYPAVNLAAEPVERLSSPSRKRVYSANLRLADS